MGEIELEIVKMQTYLSTLGESRESGSELAKGIMAVRASILLILIVRNKILTHSNFGHVVNFWATNVRYKG